MKVCIFGSDGRTGREVVEYCLNEGHEIVAFVYSENAKNYLPKNPRIKIIKGDVLSATDVQKSVKNCDAVISVFGHIKGSDSRMQTKGIINIIEAMKIEGITRIISLTGTGVRIEGDTPSIFDIIGNWIIKIIDRDRIMDGIEHVEALKKSGLDWTILRVLKLSNGDINSDKNNLIPEYKLSTHGPAEAFTSRKKVAKIMTDLLTSGKYSKQMPISS